jgi:Ser/Thr protein kinase RdoA (MazF antagonist)
MKKLDSGTLDRLLKPYDLDSASVQYLGGGREDSDGVVYAFDRDRPMAVKLMAWKEPEEDFLWTRKRYEERIRFAFYLGEGGAPVVNPVRDFGGEIYRHAHFDGHGYITYLMERAGGSPPAPELWDAKLTGLWGGAVGKMHALAARYPDWAHSPEAGRDGKPQLGWRSEVAGFRDWCRDPDVKKMWDDMERALAALPVDRASFGFIHNDPHHHNVLWDGAALRVIDFDVANYHWFMTDLGVAMQSALFTYGGFERPVEDRDALRRFVDGFLAGYEKEYHIDAAWLKRLDLFVNYRRMLLYTVMQDWLDANAAAKAGWKSMMENGALLLS